MNFLICLIVASHVWAHVPVSKSQIDLGTKIEALKLIADEYLKEGNKFKFDRTLEEINQLRPQWEDGGRPGFDQSRLQGFKKIKRTELDNLVVTDLPDLEDEVEREFNIPKYYETSGGLLKEKQILLTYDDGPSGEYTPLIRSILLENKVQAAFFQVGEMVEKFPEQTKANFDSGFVMANHSWSHPQLTKLTDDQINTQISDTQRVILEALKDVNAIENQFQGLFASLFKYTRNVYHPEFFRCPYGLRDGRVLAQVNQTLSGHTDYRGKDDYIHLLHILWSVDSLDWKDKDPKSIEDRVFKEIELNGNRGLILMHDIHPQTVEASRSIIPRLIKEGYQIITLYDMLSSVQKTK